MALTDTNLGGELSLPFYEDKMGYRRQAVILRKHLDQGAPMIARVWRATATPDGADAYREHFTGSVLPALRSLNGHRGAYLLRQDAEGQVELEVITLWESFEAIHAFAGADATSAVVEPEAQAVLLNFDKTVSHRTVVVDTVTDQT
ncbi:antibiotic biosynthesis monooxygenase [Actinomadura barringtoniae]|uniref:Antibiotic biosynthesis monooxygenase n=1 Tax=Actinomadura barringtoniae TaxID=1427535 RepID=A0A939PBA8_9ACTN|nr:antibiotic biosynthesis monooxygenase [Actinomadura barringtoniae]MBO2449278.1 antibiotic biosynthesis monooxygenase [Actinomadura barringtoniae]